ncbi:MAG: biopolymer transporter ExbD [Chlorobi bacterium]|nr:MAG: Biopolymer transport protein [Chlorobi bacterium OLB7]MBK8911198.1 biopolymer transporter ExbD [Chlorobiota bacterium]MBX7218254.1 biopolymer transporter ExbD [Candidatus Kapabacteria bacterium]
MRFTAQKKDPYLSAFNFSSLTDIVMLLLIFFLLTSSFVATEGLNVVLPQAANSDTQEDSRIYISMNEKKVITVNNQAATLQTLPEIIRAELANDSTQTVVIRADQSLLLSEVVGVLDVVKGAGARKFFIATEKDR